MLLLVVLWHTTVAKSKPRPDNYARKKDNRKTVGILTVLLSSSQRGIGGLGEKPSSIKHAPAVNDLTSEAEL